MDEIFAHVLVFIHFVNALFSLDRLSCNSLYKIKPLIVILVSVPFKLNVFCPLTPIKTDVCFFLSFLFPSHTRAVLFSYGVAVTPWLGALRAGLVLHRCMLWNIFRVPMQFFDTTPSGRILSRFSKDVEALDTVLPRLFDDGLWCGFVVKFLSFLGISLSYINC